MEILFKIMIVLIIVCAITDGYLIMEGLNEGDYTKVILYGLALICDFMIVKYLWLQ